VFSGRPLAGSRWNDGLDDLRFLQHFFNPLDDFGRHNALVSNHQECEVVGENFLWMNEVVGISRDLLKESTGKPD
jgi:hypothetical protein